MSLSYGHDGNPKPSQTMLLHYNFTYAGISLTYRPPIVLKTGHPVSYMFGGRIGIDSKLTMLSHAFDNENTITTLKLKYVLVTIRKDGSKTNTDLAEIDMSTKRVGTTNIYILDETFTISDIITDYDQIAVFYVKFKRLSSKSYGNESNIDIIVSS